jgi:hypothetical protein
MFKSHNNKLKKISAFKKILHTESDSQTIAEIAKYRTMVTQRYTEVKNSYNFELYRYLRKKLDDKIEKFEKNKKFVLEEDIMEDIKNKPKLRHFIAQPFDITEFSQKLITSLNQDDVKDLLFYNFFDLNKFRSPGSKLENADNMVLKLGDKDILRRYETKVKKIRMRRKAQRLADKILEDIQEIGAEVADSEVERMVDDAQRLINLASKL